jgi:hypothetical protein
MHCIDKHNFPRNYDFFIINDGIDRRSSMLQHAHRRRSSTLNSTNGNGRARSSTVGSTVESTVANGDKMDEGEDEDKDEESKEEAASKSPPQRAPFKLRGRGGFGRGEARGTGAAAQLPLPAAKSASSDPLESLTSGMSALNFIPQSVRLARGRGGRGRG